MKKTKPSLKGKQKLKKNNKKVQSWQAWKKGDLIDIIAPASSVSLDHLEQAKKIVENFGFKARIHEPLFDAHPYLSSQDEKRLSDLVRALKAKDSVGIWCLRGGYGAIRLLEALAKIKKEKNNKLLLGYSDITSLHHFLSEEWSWTSAHGPLLESLVLQKLDQEQISDLQKILSGEQNKISYSLKAANVMAEKNKKISGLCLGGNLMVFMSAFGTAYQPSLKNKILFFEEIDERAYRLDRLLVQLSLAKDFAKVKAIVLGDVLGGNEKNGNNFCEQAISDFAKRLERFKIPLFRDLPIGHGQRNRIVFSGQNVTIQNLKWQQETGVIL